MSSVVNQKIGADSSICEGASTLIGDDRGAQSAFYDMAEFVNEFHQQIGSPIAAIEWNWLVSSVFQCLRASEWRRHEGLGASNRNTWPTSQKDIPENPM